MGTRKHLLFGVLGFALLLTSFATYSSSVALPVIISDLDTTLILGGWVLTINALVQTIVMALAGKLTDIVGTKRAFVVYMLVFVTGSALSALAPNIHLLIAARGLQALGGGGFMPAAAQILSVEFPAERQRYIGLLSSVGPIGIILGPNIGGWMAQTLGWRSIFWINIPACIVILVLALILLPPRQEKTVRSSMDVIGAGLLSGALFAFMFSITELGGGTSGIPWVSFGVLFALSIVLMVLFMRRERKMAEPIIDFELLRRKPFLAANAYNLIYSIGALGIRALVPLYAVSIYGMTTLESGIILTPWSVGMVASSAVTSFLLTKWGYRKPIIIGTSMLVVGFALLAMLPSGLDILGLHLGVTPILLIIMGISGIGHGISNPASSNACIELMPDKVATIIGLRGVFRQLGAAMGVAGATVVLHAMTDVRTAFTVVMVATAACVLFSIPTVFAMPGSQDVKPLRGQPDKV